MEDHERRNATEHSLVETTYNRDNQPTTTRRTVVTHDFGVPCPTCDKVDFSVLSAGQD